MQARSDAIIQMTENGRTDFALAGRRVFVAGHRGMVGSAIVRRLESEDCEILTAGRTELDLLRQSEVEAWMAQKRPDVVIVAAAKVGGIHANDTYPADFLYDNLMIEANLVHSASHNRIEKLLFLGSSCIYPRDAAQPLTEEALLTAPLEPSNEWYAVAKIAGIKLCQAYRKQHGCDFISAMPTNLYGPGDNFDLKNSHVLPALMRKIHVAKRDADDEVTIWGSGEPRREFMYVDDLADALVFLLRHYSGHGHINVGVGSDLTINEVAGLMAETIGWKGRFIHERSQPDGTPRKLMDSSKLSALGWRSRTDIRDGLKRTYAWYRDNLQTARL